jgi:hypothetical protein
MWQAKLKPPPPAAAANGKTAGKAVGKVVKDDLAQGSDDTISANRFREQDELRQAGPAQQSSSRPSNHLPATAIIFPPFKIVNLSSDIACAASRRTFPGCDTFSLSRTIKFPTG